MESTTTLTNFLIIRWNENEKAVEFLESPKNIAYNEIFANYFSYVFRSISLPTTPSEQQKAPSIQRKLNIEQFFDYFALPGLIGERLFEIMISGKFGFVSEDEFIEFMTKLYNSSLYDKEYIIFRMYDCDNDGVITKKDIFALLSQVAVDDESISIPFNDMLRVKEIIDKCFNLYSHINFSTFCDMALQNETCGFIILLFLIIRNQIQPLEELRINALNGIITEKNLVLSSNLIRKFSLSEFIIKFMKSKGILHSVNEIHKKKNPILLMPSNCSELIDNEIPEEDKGELKVLQMKYANSRLVKVDSQENELTDKEDSLSYLQYPVVKGTNSPASSPRRNASTSYNENASVALSCDNMCDITINNILIPSDFEPQMTFGKNFRRYQSTIVPQLKQPEDEMILMHNDSDLVRVESQIWIVMKSDVVTKKYGVLCQKSFYIYNEEHDESYQKIYYLFSFFIKEDCKEVFDNNKKAIIVSFKGKEKMLLFENDKIKGSWLSAFRKIEKKSNISSYYAFEGVIGKGSFGLVKKAYRITTKEPVAIKIINKKETTAGLGVLKMEIECMKLCKHPNICKLIEIYENEEYLYLVTEYLEGGNLRNYIKMNCGSISEKRIKQIFAALASAVYYMQKIGIMHRDLKPENILLSDKSDTSEVKILDFGLATVKGPNQFCKEKVGTISYIAPEIHEGKQYDKAVDIWSLGIILYFLLSGKLPFEGDAEKERIKYTPQQKNSQMQVGF